MDEKHSNVPHIRKNPAIKQVTANNGRLRVCMVTRLQTISPIATAGKIVRVGNRNFNRNKTGKAIVNPMNEAYPAMRISSCISEVAPIISFTETK